MVLRAVVGMMGAAEGGVERGSMLVATVEASGNDVCKGAEEGVEEEANPEQLTMERANHNPTRAQHRPPPVVYRVTSLPLDAYSEAVKNRVRMQGEFRAALEAKKDMRAAEEKESEWGCCWTGWLCLV
jgi:hypothetical protein